MTGNAMTAEAVTADAPTAHQHPQLVVCGTDTDVGKTVVSALVVQGLGAHYWKPVQCGLEPGPNGGGDRDRVQRWLQLPAERLLPEAYRLQAPVSPHWASALESGDPSQPGPPLDPQRLALPAVPGSPPSPPSAPSGWASVPAAPAPPLPARDRKSVV